MTTIFSEDFTGTNNDPWNAAKWSVAEAQNTGGLTIQSNAGRMVASGAVYSIARARANMTAVADAEVLLSVTLATTTEQYIIVHLRATDAWIGGSYAHPTECYRVTVDTVNNVTSLDKNVASAGVPITTVGFTKSAAKWWLRFQCTGTTIRYKFWLASGSEPGTWDASVTDSSVASGKLALSYVNDVAGTSQTVTFDDIVIDDLLPAYNRPQQAVYRM